MKFFKKRGPEPKGPVEFGEVSPMIERLLQLLSGKDSAKVFEKFRLFINSLQDYLELKIHSLPKEQIIEDIKKCGIRIEEWAKSFIEQEDFLVSEKDYVSEIQFLTPAMFGFRNNVSLTEFFETVHKNNIKDCPLYVSLYICRQDKFEKNTEIYFSGSLICKKDPEKRPHILRFSDYPTQAKNRGKSPGKALELVRLAKDRFVKPDTIFAFSI